MKKLQKDYFKELTTDHLLTMRQSRYCPIPLNEQSVSHITSEGCRMYQLDKPTLLAELATRPHRVRAKDRRKKTI